MATYKVIQDIEAEDKLVGPLTLRQFIYAAVSVVCGYICFLAYTKGAPFLMFFFVPIAVVSGFFAFPWRGEQPTEIWALARIRFAIKPRVRIWDQDGMKDLVTITVPKKLESMRPTRSLTQNEVRSRLKALADTIDSRGWATRNAAYAQYGQNWIHQTVVPSVPNNSGLAVSMPSEDMFDSTNSVAQNFDALLTKSSQQNRERVLQTISQVQNPQPVEPVAAQPQYQGGALYQSYQPGGMPAFQMGQAPTLPAPVMPASYQQYQYPQPQAQPAMPGMAPGQPDGNLWFANGPAYPGNPMAAPVQAAPVQTAAVEPVVPVEPVIPVEAAAPIAAAEPVEPEAAAVEPTEVFQPVTVPGATPGARIESDVPLASAAAPSEEDAAMAAQIKERNSAVSINYGHLRVLQPIGSGAQGQAPVDYPAPVDGQADVPMSSPMGGQAGSGAAAAPAEPVTPQPDPAILKLANNDDLDIATIARQAKKEIQKAPDEVEIRLH